MSTVLTTTQQELLNDINNNGVRISSRQGKNRTYYYRNDTGERVSRTVGVLVRRGLLSNNIIIINNK